MSQSIKVNDPAVTIRAENKKAGHWIGYVFGKSKNARHEMIASLSNPSSPYTTKYNRAYRLLV